MFPNMHAYNKKTMFLFIKTITWREKEQTLLSKMWSLLALPALTVGKGREKSVSATTDVDWG